MHDEHITNSPVSLKRFVEEIDDKICYDPDFLGQEELSLSKTQYARLARPERSPNDAGPVCKDVISGLS